MPLDSIARRSLAVTLTVLLAATAAKAGSKVDFDQGVSAGAALQEVRAAASVMLTQIEHIRTPIHKIKFDRSLVGPGVYPPVGPLITGSVSYQNAANLHADPRYSALDPKVLQPLEHDWSGINTVRGDLLTQASAWEGDNDQLYSDGQQLDSERADLEQRKTALNSETDQYNQQCTTHPLPPDQYRQCLDWRSSLIARQNQLQSDIDAFNGQVTTWNQQSQAIFQKRKDIVVNVQDWETTIKGWMDSVQKAFDTNCRPLKQLDITPQTARVPTGGLTADFTARTLFQSQPQGAPPCSVDLSWMFTPHPDVPNTVIGTISPTVGATTRFTSGNFTGLGTLVAHDAVSGIGTSANVNVYNATIK